MHDAFLGLGSNLGDRAAMLRAALQAIAALPHTKLTSASTIYETAPMGPQDQRAYLNMAARVQTPLAPGALADALQRIELNLGRAPLEQRQHWGPREIDIDILLYDDRVIDEPGLTIPHPGMHDRWFVLKPLSQIAPQLVHPTLKRTIAELLRDIAAPAGMQESRGE